MKELSFDQMKQIEYEILVYLDELCEKQGIKYFLDAGTLIGAVRHKGFIPWDDDIDVGILRPDFERLMKILEGEDRYELINPKDDDCYYMFAKLCDKRTVLIEDGFPEIKGMGVYLDIFPYDVYPEERGLQASYVEKQFLLLSKLLRCFPDKRELRKFKLMAYIKHGAKVLYATFVKKDRIKDKLYLEMTKYKNVETSYVGYGLTQYKDKMVHHIDYCANTTKLAFEGGMFSVPIKWHEYLTELYGEYMKLPPIEQQKTHHEYIAYWKE